MSEALEKGLLRWRVLKLQEIGLGLEEIREDFRAASDGLAIAARNPGEVDDDVINILWDNLNDAAVQRDRLEREHERLMSLTLAELVVEFSRRQQEARWASRAFSA